MALQYAYVLGETGLSHQLLRIHIVYLLNSLVAIVLWIFWIFIRIEVLHCMHFDVFLLNMIDVSLLISAILRPSRLHTIIHTLIWLIFELLKISWLFWGIRSMLCALHFWFSVWRRGLLVPRLRCWIIIPVLSNLLEHQLLIMGPFVVVWIIILHRKGDRVLVWITLKDILYTVWNASKIYLGATKTNWTIE